MALHHPPRWRRAFAALYLSGLAVIASAATTTGAPTTTSVAPEGPQTHTVLVGSGGDYQYHPNSINASVGDVVSFQFYPTNHSVIRGEYTGSNACGSAGCNPCVPIELIDPTVPPFASKNFLTQDLPTPANLALQSFNLTVNDTNPIWFYCDAINSCLNGMVGVINPVGRPALSCIANNRSRTAAPSTSRSPRRKQPSSSSHRASHGPPRACSQAPCPRRRPTRAPRPAAPRAARPRR